jgi:hypothetical protein
MPFHVRVESERFIARNPEAEAGGLSEAMTNAKVNRRKLAFLGSNLARLSTSGFL